jgi:hypothetical protein
MGEEESEGVENVLWMVDCVYCWPLGARCEVRVLVPAAGWKGLRHTSVARHTPHAARHTPHVSSLASLLFPSVPPDSTPLACPLSEVLPYVQWYYPPTRYATLKTRPARSWPRRPA